MVGGFDVLGAAASGLQIVGLICNLGTRLLDKPKDTKAVAEIATDAQSYSMQLKQWEGQLTGDAVHACRHLRETLDAIVAEVEGMKDRKKLVNVVTALKFYKPEFREKFADALEVFKVRMCIESQKSVGEIDGKLKGMTKAMEELRITAKTLEKMPGTLSVIEMTREEMARLSEDIHNLETVSQQIRLAIEDSQQVTALIIPQIERNIKIDGETTRERIDESTATVIGHLNKVVEHLDMTAFSAESLYETPKTISNELVSLRLQKRRLLQCTVKRI